MTLCLNLLGARVRIAFDQTQHGLIDGLQTLGVVKVDGADELYDVPLIPFIDGRFLALLKPYQSAITALGVTEFN